MFVLHFFAGLSFAVVVLDMLFYLGVKKVAAGRVGRVVVL